MQRATFHLLLHQSRLIEWEGLRQGGTLSLTMKASEHVPHMQNSTSCLSHTPPQVRGRDDRCQWRMDKPWCPDGGEASRLESGTLALLSQNAERPLGGHPALALLFRKVS